MITNSAEGKPEENPAASWVFLVTGTGRQSAVSWLPSGFLTNSYSVEVLSVLHPASERDLK